MPNRVLKESIKRSPQIDALTWFEEVVFYRLIVTVDDYGCTDGRNNALRSDLFPTKDSITQKAMNDAIDKLERLGLVIKYVADGIPYLYLPTWDKHQRVRNKHRKYPIPPCCEDLSANCGQMSADCLPESNPIRIQSESEERDAPAHAREEKKAYGEFSNVFLTEAEHSALTERFGGNTEKLLNTFSCKLKAKGYTYDNHYATLILWAEEDGVGKGNDKSYDTDDFFEAALKRSYAEFDEKYGGTGS